MAEFVPLATWLAGTRDRSSEGVAVAAPPQMPASTSGEGASPGVEARDIARELSLLRLAAFEAFERAKDRLLESFAAEVLGRELALAPIDVEALAAGVLARFADFEPVALVLSPDDGGSVHASFPIRLDDALRSGDFCIDVRDGTIESTFAFRLGAALERASS